MDTGGQGSTMHSIRTLVIRINDIRASKCRPTLGQAVPRAHAELLGAGYHLNRKIL